MQVLSDFFHLACTNFVVKLTVGSLSLGMLMDVLQQTLEQTNVDILEFVSCHSVVSQAPVFPPSIGVPKYL